MWHFWDVYYKNYGKIYTTYKEAQYLNYIITESNFFEIAGTKEAKDYVKEHQFLKYVENAKRVKCTPMTCKDILNFINEKEKSIKYGAKSAGFRLVQI